MKCADYITNKDVDSHVNVYVIATVRETNQRFATRDTIWIEKPHLEVKVSVCPMPSYIEKPHLEVKVSMCTCSAQIEKPHLEVKVSMCTYSAQIEKPHLEVKVSVCMVPSQKTSDNDSCV